MPTNKIMHFFNLINWKISRFFGFIFSCKVYLKPILMTLLILLVLSFLVDRFYILNAHEEFPDFEGKYHWNQMTLKFCKTDKIRRDLLWRGQAKDPRLKCYVYRMLLNFVKVELLNIDPPLIKYHRFFPKNIIKEFIKQTKSIEIGSLKVKSQDGPDRNVFMDSRIANGTFVGHHAYTAMSKTFNYIQTRINVFNFDKAEEFQVLNYLPGGHYAPHFDFFQRNPDLEWKGNRIATFMAILKTAKEGGGTIYPNAGVTFVPRAGDAVVWFNMNPDYTRADYSLHGACPVINGTKLGITLWIRSKGQEIRYPCPLKEKTPFDYEFLVKPKWKPQDWRILNGLPIDL